MFSLDDLRVLQLYFINDCITIFCQWKTKSLNQIFSISGPGPERFPFHNSLLLCSSEAKFFPPEIFFKNSKISNDVGIIYESNHFIQSVIFSSNNDLSHHTEEIVAEHGSDLTEIESDFSELEEVTKISDFDNRRLETPDSLGVFIVRKTKQIPLNDSISGKMNENVTDLPFYSAAKPKIGPKSGCRITNGAITDVSNCEMTQKKNNLSIESSDESYWAQSRPKPKFRNSKIPKKEHCARCHKEFNPNNPKNCHLPHPIGDVVLRRR